MTSDPVNNLNTTNEENYNIGRAKRYSKTNQIISLIETVIFFGLILLILFSGLSKKIEAFAYDISSNHYAALLIFFTVIGIAEAVLSFPLSFYSEYYLEHKYNLSNQNLKTYFTEKLKGMAVGLILGIPLLISFYFLLRNFGDSWWIITGMLMIFVTVVLGRIAPTLIMPLFYKFRPIENEEIKDSIIALCKKAGVQIKGIFYFDMSKNTKKANAAFTGIGKSKRIILGDTLLNNFTKDEIEMVFSHEMGHYKKKHILKLMTLSVVLTFGGLYFTSLLFKSSLEYFGFGEISEIAALPLLFLYLSIFGLITSPLSNILSRKFEWEADTFALETTGNKTAFISAMEKLAEQNLSDKSPNKIIEFLFHSHPSIEKRILFAQKFRL